MQSLRTVFSSPLFAQPVRWRHVPDPGTLEQRLLRAVTRPVLPPTKVTPLEKRLTKEEESRRFAEANPYKRFLVNRARRDFFELASGRMLLIYQILVHEFRDFVLIRNSLFDLDVNFHGFPVSILREAASSTPWQTMTAHLHDGVKYAYTISDADPVICRKVIDTVRKAPFLLLLGGVVQHRMMTVDQLKEFAASSLDSNRSNLVGSLEQARGQQLLQSLNQHQNDLVLGLHQLTSAADQTPSS